MYTITQKAFVCLWFIAEPNFMRPAVAGH